MSCRVVAGQHEGRARRPVLPRRCVANATASFDPLAGDHRFDTLNPTTPLSPTSPPSSPPSCVGAPILPGPSPTTTGDAADVAVGKAGSPSPSTAPRPTAPDRAASSPCGGGEARARPRCRGDRGNHAPWCAPVAVAFPRDDAAVEPPSSLNSWEGFNGDVRTAQHCSRERR